jgi:hypothetical protein
MGALLDLGPAIVGTDLRMPGIAGAAGIVLLVLLNWRLSRLFNPTGPFEVGEWPRTNPIRVSLALDLMPVCLSWVSVGRGRRYPNGQAPENREREDIGLG